MAKASTEERLVVATYRKAWHHYEILEEFEAGLCLKGPEVKSLRAGQVAMDGSFARVEGEELFLHNLHIQPYKNNTVEEIPPARPRKLLMRHKDILKLLAKQQVKGLSLIPLEIYFKGSWAKVRLSLAKGKRGPDKRESIKKREASREMERQFKGRFKV